MQHTVRVTLSRSNLIGFGVMLTCECGKPDFVPGSGEPLSSWSCDWCGRPLVIISESGEMYLVGNKVLNRGVDESG